MASRRLLAAVAMAVLALAVLVGACILWVERSWWHHKLASGTREEMLEAVKRLGGARISVLFPILVVELTEPEIESRLSFLHLGMAKACRSLERGAATYSELEAAFRSEVCKPWVTPGLLVLDQKDRVSSDPVWQHALEEICDDKDYPAPVRRSIAGMLWRIKGR